MEIEKEKTYLDESYIIENNNSEIIDNDTSDNISSNQENDDIDFINEDEASENEANTSQAYEGNADTETDVQTNFRSIVHLHFDKDKKLKKYKCKYCR